MYGGVIVGLVYDKDIVWFWGRGFDIKFVVFGEMCFF